MTQRVWPVLVASAAGIAVLCSLGAWQVQRLGQKQKLIVELQERMEHAPVSLHEALARFSAGEDVEYLKVSDQGVFEAENALRKQTSHNGMPDWELIAPFKALDGSEVLVDLGVYAGGRTGAIPLVGILRLHNKGRGLFDPENDVENDHWFWWDLPAMQKAAGISGPLVIVQSLQSGSGFDAAEPKIELANNHLGYAITWFGLAAALAGVAGAFVLRKPDA